MFLNLRIEMTLRDKTVDRAKLCWRRLEDKKMVTLRRPNILVKFSI